MPSTTTTAWRPRATNRTESGHATGTIGAAIKGGGDLVNLFPVLLFAHVLGAIIAFGPTFSFPIIGAMGGRERMHGNFATRVSERIAMIQVEPLAVLQGITGLSLIYFGNIDLFKSTWLLIAIPLYLIALSYALFVQNPAVKKVVAMTG